MNRIEQDTITTHKDNGDETPIVDIRDLVAPKSLDFMNSDYVLVDGIYRTHFFVKANGFPMGINTEGWLNAFAECGYGYDLDTFFFKGNSTEAIRNIQLHAKLSILKVSQKDEEELDYNSAIIIQLITHKYN